jgi:IS30 family transposase
MPLQFERWGRRFLQLRTVGGSQALAGEARSCLFVPQNTQSSKFTHLTRTDREIIRRMRGSTSLSAIARLLGKHRSTVSRELRRNANAGGIYFELHADAATRKRRLCAKEAARIIENNPDREALIERMLGFKLSPEQIAGFLRRSGHPLALSYRTVYRWVHRAWQSRKQYLRHRGKPRVPYGQKKNSWDPDKRHISERPRIVSKRTRVGDWEADLVHGTQDDSRHCLLTLNERATGFCIIRKLTALDSTYVASVIIDALQGLPVETITCDNGFEFGRHRYIERKLRCKMYFTDPNSPQQRGSNENLNGLLRDFFPKGRSLAHVSQMHATEAAKKLNGRPRKRYGYEAPRTLFARMTGRSPFFVR